MSANSLQQLAMVAHGGPRMRQSQRRRLLAHTHRSSRRCISSALGSSDGCCCHRCWQSRSHCSHKAACRGVVPGAQPSATWCSSSVSASSRQAATTAAWCSSASSASFRSTVSPLADGIAAGQRQGQATRAARGQCQPPLMDAAMPMPAPLRSVGNGQAAPLVAAC